MNKCPICQEELINVGALAEYEDEKDNHCCKGCKRVWVIESEDEWWTRPAEVIITGKIQVGDVYGQVVSPKSSPSYEAWKAALIKVTAEMTKQPESEVKINDESAREWYDSGASPYMTFRETYQNENDAS